MEAESFAAFDEELERTFRSIPAGGPAGAERTGAGAASGVTGKLTATMPTAASLLPRDAAPEATTLNQQQQQQQQQGAGPQAHLRALDATARWNIARKVAQSIDRHLVPNMHLTRTSRKLLKVGEKLTALGIYSTARSKCFKPIIKQQRYAGAAGIDDRESAGIVDATEAHVRAIYLSATALVAQGAA